MHSKSYRFLTPLIMVLTWANMEAQTSHPVPRLVVNVTIDQLRTDYMEAFSSLFGAGGFNKVMRDGRSYMDAAYPFSQYEARLFLPTGAFSAPQSQPFHSSLPPVASNYGSTMYVPHPKRHGSSRKRTNIH